MGKNVLDSTKNIVSAEIFKTAGSQISLYHNNRLVTDFTKTVIEKQFWWIATKKTTLDKVWIENINNL